MSKSLKPWAVVTGAGGFIGHHLVSYLKAAGYRVRAVDIKPPEYRGTDADELMLLDLRELKNCQTCTTGMVAYIKTGSLGFMHGTFPRSGNSRKRILWAPRLGWRWRSCCFLAAAVLMLCSLANNTCALHATHPAGGARWPLAAIHPAQKPKKKPVTLTLPILRELEEVLAASPLGDLTWLVTAFGKDFTAAGFGNWFRDQCNKAGLRQCSAHGLRKAGATIAADNGASAQTLMMIFGWSTLKQAEHYTRSADRKRLAATGMHLIVPGQKRNKSAQQS